MDHFFKVFPNPVASGANLAVELKETEEGYHLLEMISQAGQAVHHQEIWIDTEAKLLSFDIPAVAAGTYFIRITNRKSGKSATEKIIVR